MRNLFVRFAVCLIIVGMLSLSVATAQWVKTTGPTSSTYIGMVSANGGTGIAGNTAGMQYVSTDSGVTWAHVTSGLDGMSSTTGLAVSGNYLYVATMLAMRISTSNGATWHSPGGWLAQRRVSALGIIGGAIFAGTSDSGIYISTDTGAAWTPASSGLSTSAAVSCFAANGDSISPAPKGTAFSYQPITAQLACRQFGTYQ